MSEAPEPNANKLKRAQTLFQYGNDAAIKNNYKYAIEMYREACKLVPDNLQYRQALRGIERRKFDNDPSKVGMFVTARIQPIRLRAKAEKAKGHWDRVLEICEEAFLINPWDVGSSRDAAEAAEHLGRPELACWMLEAVHAQAGDDIEFIRHLAHVYELNEQWQKAIACWERLRKLSPADEQAKRQINALTASATIARSGLGEAIQQKSADEEASSREISVPGLEDLKESAETPEERMLREIAAEPDRVGPYLELADLYKLNNRLDEAEKILSRGRKIIPSDEVLRSAYADIQMSRLRRAIDGWTKRVEQFPDDTTAQAKLDQLRQKLDAYELNELRHRAKLHPTDAQVRLDLGICLARLGHHDEAIAEFQQARGNPDLKVKALQRAGQSFEAKGLYKLAERNLQEALKLADAEDQALINDLHYRLGRVAEAQGDITSAEEHYNEVAANDYTYLDVAERLRALNEKRSS